jgi:hypothetical protein
MGSSRILTSEKSRSGHLPCLSGRRQTELVSWRRLLTSIGAPDDRTEGRQILVKISRTSVALLLASAVVIVGAGAADAAPAAAPTDDAPAMSATGLMLESSDIRHPDGTFTHYLSTDGATVSRVDYPAAPDAPQDVDVEFSLQWLDQSGEWGATESVHVDAGYTQGDSATLASGDGPAYLGSEDKGWAPEFAGTDFWGEYRMVYTATWSVGDQVVHTETLTSSEASQVACHTASDSTNFCAVHAGYLEL